MTPYSVQNLTETDHNGQKKVEEKIFLKCKDSS